MIHPMRWAAAATYCILLVVSILSMKSDAQLRTHASCILDYCLMSAPTHVTVRDAVLT
jgi:hypothetical protein